MDTFEMPIFLVISDKGHLVGIRHFSDKYLISKYKTRSPLGILALVS